MNYVLFDDHSWNNLLPLTFTRPVSEIRIGIFTITQKWNNFLDSKISYLTKDYLSKKYPGIFERDNMLINGSIIPDKITVNAIMSLKHAEVLIKNDIIIAARLNSDQIKDFKNNNLTPFTLVKTSANFNKINYPWDIFQLNENAIIEDFEYITKGRATAPLSNTNKAAGIENIFIEPGASVEFSIINGTTGPVYIGKDAEVMEGSMIRGPFALCEHSAVKMGAKIYGATTIGPHCKVGGELNNSILIGYSNKAHDGFLGNAVIGEWCNLGADTNNSNLKNNYAQVKVWNYVKESFINTGLQFCGLIMGDHSKSGINTMFNTGTVVGISANIFGAGFPRNFIPSFSFGGYQGYSVYNLDKAYEVATLVMKRRNLEFTEADKDIFKNVFSITEKYRKY